MSELCIERNEFSIKSQPSSEFIVPLDTSRNGKLFFLILAHANHEFT